MANAFITGRHSSCMGVKWEEIVKWDWIVKWDTHSVVAVERAAHPGANFRSDRAREVPSDLGWRVREVRLRRKRE